MVLCDQAALLKVLAHAAKFPSHSVNGALLGTVGAAGVEVHDAIPLCHTTLALAPAVEIGLAQVESYTHVSGNMEIVGYYHSDSRFGPGDLPPLGRRTADRIADRQPRAAVLVLDNKKLEEFCKGKLDNPFDLFSKDGTKGWRRVGDGAGEGPTGGLQLISSDWKRLREEFFSMFKQLKHRTLTDFEEHLDDASKCWLNKGFAGGKFVLPGNTL